MSWNFRVMKCVHKGETCFRIHEVYYKTNSDSEVDGYTEDGVAALGETVDELREELQRMLLALDKPVLDYE